MYLSSSIITFLYFTLYFNIEIKGFNHQLKSFSKPTHTEPELLRVLNVARESAALFTNGCAMVVYGIPVKLEEE